MRKKDGKYVCMVKGGHCIDITYYHPGENITTFYEEDQGYCHKRSCAKKTFRVGFYLWIVHEGPMIRGMTHTVWLIPLKLRGQNWIVFINLWKYERLCGIGWFHFGSLEKKIWKQKSKYHHHWRYGEIRYEGDRGLIATGAKEHTAKFKFRHKAFAKKSISMSWDLWLTAWIYGNILHVRRLQHMGYFSRSCQWWGEYKVYGNFNPYN